MSRIKCKVVQSLQDKVGHEVNDIVTNKVFGLVWWTEGHTSLSPVPIEYQNQKSIHINFVSERKVDINDWFYVSNLNCKEGGKILQCKDYDILGYPTTCKIKKGDREERGYHPSNIKRIEATTDKTLKLPLIDDKFKDKYVEEEGNIPEVRLKIEYIGFQEEGDLPIVATYCSDGNPENPEQYVVWSEVREEYKEEDILDLLDKFDKYKVFTRRLTKPEIKAWLELNN